MQRFGALGRLIEQLHASKGRGATGQKRLAMLPRAQQLARATLLQIHPGDFKAIVGAYKRPKALVWLRQQEAPALRHAAPHASAQLMELRQPRNDPHPQ